MTDPTDSGNPQPAETSKKWLVGLMLICLAQVFLFIGSENTIGLGLLWLLLSTIGLALLGDGIADHIHRTRLRPGKMRQFKMIALVLGGCGLLVQLYDSFRHKHVPQDPDPTWGLGLVLILAGLVVLVFARFGKTKWTMAFRVLVFVALIVGAIWYVAVINLNAFPIKARQSEARTNLSGIFVAEMAFYEENKRFGTFDEIGFSLVNPTNRYTYRIDISGRPGTIIPTRNGTPTPDNTIVPAGLSLDGQAFTATATGHIDNDDTIDQWHVNNIKQNLQNADTDDRRN